VRQYLDALKYVLENGVRQSNRTGVETIGVFPFPQSLVLDLRGGFPLVTTKRVFYRGVLTELLWFIDGGTNIAPLVQQGVHIWDDWPYAKYCQSGAFAGETKAEFAQRVATDPTFATQWGKLGPVYGKQWRSQNGVDQLSRVIADIKAVRDNPNHPARRRLIVCAWNPAEIDQMALPPCHFEFTFNVVDGILNLDFIMRSVDMFLGLPFNIASYATLLMMVAQVTGLTPGQLSMHLQDAHIYVNHLDQVREQLSRSPLPLPRLVLNPKVRDIDGFASDDVVLDGYQYHPPIRGEIAV